MESPVGLAKTVRFGMYEADLEAGELRKRGRKVRLQDQPFQVLALLLTHHGEVVTRGELQQGLWPAGTFIEFEHGVNTAIKKIRRALGDSAENPRFIETLPKKGYRFIAPVEPVEPPAPTPQVGRRRILVWGLSLLIALAIGVRVWIWFVHPSCIATATVSALAAHVGYESEPALSPDGKQVAFVWNGGEPDNQDIYVQLVGEEAPRRLTSSPALEYSPVWSPDALRIAFLRETTAGTEVNIIPAAGGVEEKVYVSTVQCGAFGTAARQFCGLAWSPNGKFLTIVDKESEKASNSIFLLDIRTRKRRKLTTAPSGWFGDGSRCFRRMAARWPLRASLARS